ncbi:MAG: radical SAM protein [Chloroflexi bacterium]|nr:radical SAM protein [Chloroflexota bacterium]
MITQDRIRVALIRELAGLVAGQGALRRTALNVAGSKAHRFLVGNYHQDRPLQVRKDMHSYLMAMLHGVDRAIERGHVSRHAVRRLVDVFVGNVLLRHGEDADIVASLGFVPPKFVLVSPTGTCNLRCVGCYAESDPGNHASLDFDTFDRILTEKRELWGSHFTVISGGEPFLWRDGERDLLDMVAKHDTDFFMVYTNGTLIDDETARRMAELGNISPAISVEGFEKETDARRGKGTHRKVLAAFDNLRRHGVPFGVSMTPTRNNWDIITSDRFADFYFDEQGAVYGWSFQYMPIGRGQTLDLMVPPEERVEMLRRMQRLVRERKVFLGDFWNSGPTSCGCICAGRSGGGYIYIDWNGDITPCGFVPYSQDNICKIYSEGGNLNSALDSPLFKRIRKWQDEYGFAQPAEAVQNWLCPCVIRDHFDVLRDAVLETGAKPINEEAAIALQDPEYRRGMVQYGRDIKRLTDPIWAAEYVSAGMEARAVGERARSTLPDTAESRVADKEKEHVRSH